MLPSVLSYLLTEEHILKIPIEFRVNAILNSLKLICNFLCTMLFFSFRNMKYYLKILLNKLSIQLKEIEKRKQQVLI